LYSNLLIIYRESFNSKLRNLVLQTHLLATKNSKQAQPEKHAQEEQKEKS